MYEGEKITVLDVCRKEGIHWSDTHAQVHY